MTPAIESLKQRIKVSHIMVKRSICHDLVFDHKTLTYYDNYIKH